MTVPERREGSLSEAAPMKFSLPDADPARDRWEQARDARLSAFVRARLAHTEATGCSEERRWAAGISEVFAEWDAKRELAARAGLDSFSAQVNALGWALRCVAHSTWRSAPGWERDFHPQAIPSNHTSETPQ
ncbi:hypothetical protein ACF1AO_34360 [Streptomyces longwoodensis]|uniref:hypothetical protein n=1 Tax=Streptomyces longwoodensis TaxID=68231 RepID=UPI0037030E06